MSAKPTERQIRAALVAKATQAPAPTSGNTECTHELWEREAACADGYCPLCMAQRLQTPTSGNDEVEAMCKRLEGAFNQLPVIEQAVALFRKKAAQIVNLTDRLEMDYRDAQIAELAALTVARAEDIQARDAQIAELQTALNVREDENDGLTGQIAELQRALQRAALDTKVEGLTIFEWQSRYEAAITGKEGT